jgi:hypothetical protein
VCGLDSIYGHINNRRRCHWNPHTIVGPGADQLTTAQADALALIYRPMRDPVTGEWLMSAEARGSEFNWLDFGYENGLASTGVERYQIAFADPTWNGIAFAETGYNGRRSTSTRISQFSTTCSVSSTHSIPI